MCVSCVLCVVVVVVVVLWLWLWLWWRREERRRREETNRTIWLLIPAKVSLKIVKLNRLYQVKRMIGGIGDMLFSIYSQT